MKIFYKILMIMAMPMSMSAQNYMDSIPVNSLDEVVISASKSLEKKSELIQRINVISSKEIANNNAQTTASLIENHGNAYVQKSQAGGGSIVIRGFEANRVVMLVDGVRMNNLIYRGGHLQNIITIDNNILDRIEILDGPASTIYGSDALGGVVNMFTRKPLLSIDDNNIFVGNAFYRYGSASNSSSAHLEFNVGTKKFASLTSLSFGQYGDLKMGREKNPFYKKFGERNFYVERYEDRDSLVVNTNPLIQKFSGYSQYDLLQKFLFKQSDFITHQINIQFSNSSNVPRYDRLTDPKGNGLNSAEWYYGPQTRLLTAYDLNYAKPGAGIDEIHAGVNYQYLVESRHNRRFGATQLSSRVEYVNIVGYHLGFVKRINRQAIRFGIDGQYSMVQSTANQKDILTLQKAPLDTRYPDGKNNMNSIAVYLTHTGKLGKHFVLSDGIRFGYTTLYSSFVDTNFFDFPFESINQKNFVLSGNLGIIYNPSEKWKIALMGSTGFRVPNIDDITKVFETAPGRIIVANNDLKAEKTINGEFNLTKFFSDKVSWENSVWATYYLDAIQVAPFQYNGQDTLIYGGVSSRVFANQNVGKAYLFGYSTNLKVSLSKRVSAIGSLNYTRGRVFTDSTDAPLDHVAPLFGKVGVTYSHAKLYAEVYSVFNGWKRVNDYSNSGEDNLQYATVDGMPAWFTMNMKVSYQVQRNLSLMAGVENLFNTQYRTFASGINAPGINLYATLKINW